MPWSEEKGVCGEDSAAVGDEDAEKHFDEEQDVDEFESFELLHNEAVSKCI